MTSRLGSFFADVRGTVLTGLSTASAAAVTATDSILAAVGKQAAAIANLMPASNGLGYWNGTTFSAATIAGALEMSTNTLRSAELTASAKSASFGLVEADRGTIIIYTGSSAATMTVPSASVPANGWSVIVVHAGTGTTLATKTLTGSGTLDGQTIWGTYPGEIRRIYSDGTNIKSIVLKGFVLEVLAADSGGSFLRPTGYSSFQVDQWGAGGGGGGGGRAATATQVCGGAGGGGGAHIRILVPYAYLSTSATCVVGVGGTAGAAATGDSLGGSAGSFGGNTQLGSLSIAYGGANGTGTTLSVMAGGGGGGTLGAPATPTVGSPASGGPPSLSSGTTVFTANHFGGAGSGIGTTGWPAGEGGGSGGGVNGATTGFAGGCSLFGGSGGGGGGTLQTANTSGISGAGGSASGSTGGGGTAPTAGSGAAGGAGTAGPTAAGPGTAGGGGASNLSGAAGAGGAGGIACGGGGGGASRNGNAAGVGGAGGGGLIRIEGNI